jgi:DNA-binding transcriptional LysR family regulator
MRFDLTDLRLFLNIVEAGTITAGAERTHMTLASASQRVRGMEDTLGSALLLRHAHGVAPTEAGRTLVHHARVVLQQMAQLQGELGEYGKGLKGHVRLQCNTSAMTEHLPEPLGRFLALNPRVGVDLEERPSQDIVEAVQAGLCDIGIVSDAVDVQGLERLTFRRDDLVLVVPQGHALARRRKIALADIGDSEFIGLAPGNPLQEHIERQARRLGKRLDYRVRVRSFEAICGMVEQGIGVGIVPIKAAGRCAATMRIRCIALTDAWAARHLLACVRAMDALSPNARRLLQLLLPQDA